MKKALAMMVLGLFMVATTVAVYAQDTATTKKTSKKSKKSKKSTDTKTMR